ncbi:unnamed protein product [Pedinophyceae sp. YPF-701]|nr:unnamed protein product [Pedinophyceae sp. YPF-701]
MYSSNSTAAQEWARKRREKIERAKELREARKREREAGPYEGGFGSCAAGGDVDNAAPDYDFGPAPTRADPSPPRDRGGYDRGPPPVQPRANAGPRAAPPYTKPTSQPSSGSLGGYGASGRYQPPPLYYFDDQGSAKKAFEIPQPKPNVNYVPDDPRDPANYGNRPLGDYEAPRRHAEDADGTWTTTLRGALPDNDLQPARAKSRADKSRNAPRRPEWNNDFVEDFSLGAPPEPEPAPAPAPRRTVRKAPPRPDWNNEFAEPETTVDGAFPAAPPPRPSPGAQASSGRINRQGLARLKDRMAGRRAGGSAGSGGSATPSPAPSRGPSERARPAQPPAPSRGPSGRARPPATDEEYRAPARRSADAGAWQTGASAGAAGGARAASGGERRRKRRRAAPAGAGDPGGRGRRASGATDPVSQLRTVVQRAGAGEAREGLSEGVPDEAEGVRFDAAPPCRDGRRAGRAARRQRRRGPRARGRGSGQADQARGGREGREVAAAERGLPRRDARRSRRHGGDQGRKGPARHSGRAVAAGPGPRAVPALRPHVQRESRGTSYSKVYQHHGKTQDAARGGRARGRRCARSSATGPHAVASARAAPCV